MDAPNFIAEVLVPLEAKSLNKRDAHFMTRSKHVKKVRSATHWAMKQVKNKPALPCVVTLCRVANSTGLDAHDNLPGSLKAFVDGVADWLGIDDRDPRVTWQYEQKRGAEYGVLITVKADA